MIVELIFSRPTVVEMTVSSPTNGSSTPIPGQKGDDGLSAYELAVLNGFNGSVGQWLESLKGADGKSPVVEIKDGSWYIDGSYSGVKAKGESLQFNWDGTKLGVKTESEDEFQYVDLQGAKGESSKTRTTTYYKRSKEKPNAPEVYDEGGLSGDWFNYPPAGSYPLWLVFITFYFQQTLGTYVESVEGPFLCLESIPENSSSSSVAEHATSSEVRAMHISEEERNSWNTIEERLRDGVDEDGDTLAKLKLLIDGLKLLINGDDINLDSIKELADYIKANRSVIEQISTDKLNVRDVYNALDYTASGKALDARQGKVLNDSISTLLTNLSNKLDRALTANSIWVGDSSGKPTEIETIPIVSQALAYDGQLWKEDFEMSVNAGNSTIARIPCILALSTSTAQNRVLQMAAGTGKTILLTSATLVTTSIGGTVGGENITVELCTNADGSGVVANLNYAYSSTPKYYEATFSNKLVSLSSGLFLKVSGRTSSSLFNYITVLVQGCYV